MFPFKLARRYCTSGTTDLINYSLQTYEPNGFGGHISKAKVISAENGNLLVNLKIEQEYINVLGSVHGGFWATLVDTLCTYALMTHTSRNFIPSLVSNMQISYLKHAALGDEVVVDIRSMQTGKTMGFLNCEIRNKVTNELLVTASHTQATKPS